MPKNFLPVPDWFSVENQGGNIAVADLSHSGKQDLLVLTVDNPGGVNRGIYRIGRKLDGNGNVTGGWTGWRDVDGWFSWENQGVGAAVLDLPNTGRNDLLVFQIDNAVEQNQAFYKIGTALDVNGNVTGWGPWLGVPGWFAWENQG